ncbi:MAG: ligand-binding protein SH3 [Candidatus Zambryskibacteria bacterium CG_4_9_14_3_um_filter_42_9]|uniref:Ligand-binding protein SH3 n=1 Tax=Candidatus Zambryskibacteria bacterium CG22_combo_CG10-13_8_21_14_all_42_17 TaxID=1975118 RepID=A0A2H0BF71_9BACT|nr:MAG: ligand-binding protein SH3 [Candidatus Zambryskibacteria bacterium CG22_combo_CG10-13_8_21_14_all_42_17]PJA36675.1 MAG: ligand-binding protein SH3 [Candidatus Zambryskibacteria bacterium CG_4_9_14_3_um_filter_42_9]
MFEIFHIMVLSMLPVIELRGAIPYAMAVYGFSAWSAFFIALIGNIIPALILVPFIGGVGEFFSEKSDLWKRFYPRFLARTRDNHQKKFEMFKEFSLVALVAIPLPLTGVWTASLVAYIFGIPFRKAIPLMFIGVIIAGTIVTLATMGFITLFSLGGAVQI